MFIYFPHSNSFSRKIFKTVNLLVAGVELMFLTKLKIDRNKVQEYISKIRKVYPLIFDVEEFVGFQFKSRKELFYFIIDEIWELKKRSFGIIWKMLEDVFEVMRYTEIIWEEIKNEKYIIPNEDIIWELFCLRTIQLYKS